VLGGTSTTNYIIRKLSKHSDSPAVIWAESDGLLELIDVFAVYVILPRNCSAK